MTKTRYNEIKEMDEEELKELFFEKLAEAFRIDRWTSASTVNFYGNDECEEFWLAGYLLRKHHLDNVNDFEDEFDENISIEEDEEEEVSDE